MDISVDGSIATDSIMALEEEEEVMEPKEECHLPPGLGEMDPPSSSLPPIDHLTMVGPSPSTAESVSTLPSISDHAVAVPLRPRNSSPYLRSHQRSRSSAASPLAAPPMTRAHSSPVMPTAGGLSSSGHVTASTRPSSPLNTYRRYHSPSRRAKDEAAVTFGGQSLTGIGETVWEETEAGTGAGTGSTTSDVVERRYGSPALPAYHSHTFPRRHRPSSPLHQVLSPATFVPTRPPPTTSSPSAPAILSKYNEAYPTAHHGLSVSVSSISSMPSTPTSMRSRSPSVSSLETIPDSPDAEEAALEAERIARLKAAADAADAADGVDSPSTTVPMVRRRSYLDVSHASSGAGYLVPSPGSFYGSRDKRKRWSVCGAERRGDLDLETIWED